MKRQRESATAPDTGRRTQLKREQRHLHTHIRTEGQLFGKGRQTDRQTDNEKRQTGDKQREIERREKEERD